MSVSVGADSGLRVYWMVLIAIGRYWSGLVGQDTFGQYLALYGESQDGDTVGSINGLVG